MTIVIIRWMKDLIKLSSKIFSNFLDSHRPVFLHSIFIHLQLQVTILMKRFNKILMVIRGKKLYLILLFRLKKFIQMDLKTQVMEKYLQIAFKEMLNLKMSIRKRRKNNKLLHQQEVQIRLMITLTTIKLTKRVILIKL